MDGQIESTPTNADLVIVPRPEVVLLRDLGVSPRLCGSCHLLTTSPHGQSSHSTHPQHLLVLLL